MDIGIPERYIEAPAPLDIPTEEEPEKVAVPAEEELEEVPA